MSGVSVPMHFDEGALQALLDGELDASAATLARQHVEGCVKCRGLLEALSDSEALLQRVLPALDHRFTALAAGQVIARGRAQRRQTRLRWAAVIAVTVIGTGALYAVPGSPLRRWIGELVGGGASPHNPIAETEAGPTAGIALKPGDRFRITVAQAGPFSGSVTIQLSDDSIVAARRVGGTARFVAEIDGLRIEPTSGRADFVIGIPRTAHFVELVVKGRRVFLKEGSRIVADSRPDSLGRYVLTLSFD